MSRVSQGNGSLVIDGVEWRPFVNRNMPLWHQFSSVYGHLYHVADFGVKYQFDYLSLTVHGTYTYTFRTDEQAKGYAAAVLGAVNTRDKIDSLEEKYLSFGEELLVSLRSCVADLNPATWAEFVGNYRRYAGGLSITTIVGRQGAELLERRLCALGVGEREAEGVVNAITYPDEHTPLFLSQRDMLQIGADVQAGITGQGQRRQRLEEWLEQYGHIPVGFVDEPWSLADAEKRLGEVLQKDCQATLGDFESNHESRIKERERKLKEVADEEVSTLAYAIQKGTYLNEFRKGIFSRVSLGYRPIFREVAERAGLAGWRQCFYLSPDEMARIIKGEDILADSLVKKRDVVGLMMKGDRLTVLDGELARELLQVVKEGVVEQAGGVSEQAQLEDVVANKGKVRGRVRVVLGVKDFNKVQAGDVLVAAMTSVDFVPVMEKAAAFVTDEGGITSHAAIVAREMNKPCIIGTKIATQVLKDGNLVEVDAEKGIVRKI